MNVNGVRNLCVLVAGNTHTSHCVRHVRKMPENVLGVVTCSTYLRVTTTSLTTVIVETITIVIVALSADLLIARIVMRFIMKMMSAHAVATTIVD
jgi:hypothetical protein